MEDKNIDKNLNIEDMGEDNNHERALSICCYPFSQALISYQDFPKA